MFKSVLTTTHNNSHNHAPQNKINSVNPLEKSNLSLARKLLSNAMQTLSNKLSRRNNKLLFESDSKSDTKSDLESVWTDGTEESLSMTELLCKIAKVENDTILAKRGYKKIGTIANTLQGELIKAVNTNATDDKYYAIKITDKSLSQQGIAIQDEVNFVVSEDIVKEGLILKYLLPYNKSICKFVDFFETQTEFYLVTEWVSEYNLKQFVQIAHHHINQKRMDVKHYQKSIKYLFWRLSRTINFLHNDMNCCHLDITMENIMVRNGDFIQQKDKYKINPKISAVLIDFGVAEIFRPGTENGFMCLKHDLSLENAFLAPQVFLEKSNYSATAADMWSLGHIVYECLTGQILYEPEQLWAEYGNDDESDSDNEQGVSFDGYKGIENGNLGKILTMRNTLHYFNPCTFDLLKQLLNVNEKQRLTAANALKHQWVKKYNKKYNDQIQNKPTSRKKESVHKENLMHFPFYELP